VGEAGDGAWSRAEAEEVEGPYVPNTWMIFDGMDWLEGTSVGEEKEKMCTEDGEERGFCIRIFSGGDLDTCWCRRG